MRRILLPLLGTLLWLTSCAQNPVTGDSDFVVLTEEQEIALGRREHPKILKRFGVYEDPELQAYVQRIGEELAAKSHRSNLVYRFTVLDTQDVNAFALPGGYIYITRGLMAYLDSEAELAAVLGHEIGHVTARHGVQQYSAAMAANLGYAVGSIFLPELRTEGAQDLFNTIGGALLSGYGREHELEADRLGAEYLARTDYNPQAMIDVISVLKDQEEFEKQLAAEEGREPRVYHGLFATHPDNDTRLQQVVGKAEALKTGTTTRVGQQQYLRSLEGLTFGYSTREGILRGNHFYHKDLGFALTFPAGWRVDNRPDHISASPRDGSAWLQMTAEDINRRISPRKFIRQRLGYTELEHGEPLNVHGLRGYSAVVDARTPFGRRQMRLSVIYLKDMAYIFAGASKNPADFFRYDPYFLGTARGFHALTEDEIKLAEALHLHLITATPSTRFEDLAAKSRLTTHAEEQLRLLNGMYPSGEPTPGDLVKTVQ